MRFYDIGLMKEGSTMLAEQHREPAHVLLTGRVDKNEKRSMHRSCLSYTYEYPMRCTSTRLRTLSGCFGCYGDNIGVSI